MKNEIVKFKAQKKEYGLTVIDRDGEKWVTAQQLGEAIGTKQIRRLIHDLTEAGELLEKKHFRSVTVQKSSRGNPARLVLSYRGVIRVAMRSQGARAKQFRDWAEDVLYEVMMTGKYDADKTQQLLHEGVVKGINMFQAFTRLGITDFADIAKLCYFRKMGLTQREAARVFEVSRGKIQNIERYLKEAGITLECIHGSQRKKMMNDFFDQMALVPSKKLIELRE